MNYHDTSPRRKWRIPTGQPSSSVGTLVLNSWKRFSITQLLASTNVSSKIGAGVGGSGGGYLSGIPVDVLDTSRLETQGNQKSAAPAADDADYSSSTASSDDDRGGGGDDNYKQRQNQHSPPIASLRSFLLDSTNKGGGGYRLSLVSWGPNGSGNSGTGLALQCANEDLDQYNILCLIPGGFTTASASTVGFFHFETNVKAIIEQRNKPPTVPEQQKEGTVAGGNPVDTEEKDLPKKKRRKRISKQPENNVVATQLISIERFVRSAQILTDGSRRPTTAASKISSGVACRDDVASFEIRPTLREQYDAQKRRSQVTNDEVDQINFLAFVKSQAKLYGVLPRIAVVSLLINYDLVATFSDGRKECVDNQMRINLFNFFSVEESGSGGDATDHSNQLIRQNGSARTLVQIQSCTALGVRYVWWDRLNGCVDLVFAGNVEGVLQPDVRSLRDLFVDPVNNSYTSRQPFVDVVSGMFVARFPCVRINFKDAAVTIKNFPFKTRLCASEFRSKLRNKNRWCDSSAARRNGNLNDVAVRVYAQDVLVQSVYEKFDAAKISKENSKDLRASTHPLMGKTIPSNLYANKFYRSSADQYNKKDFFETKNISYAFVMLRIEAAAASASATRCHFDVEGSTVNGEPNICESTMLVGDGLPEALAADLWTNSIMWTDDGKRGQAYYTSPRTKGGPNLMSTMGAAIGQSLFTSGGEYLIDDDGLFQETEMDLYRRVLDSDFYRRSSSPQFPLSLVSPVFNSITVKSLGPYHSLVLLMGDRNFMMVVDARQKFQRFSLLYANPTVASRVQQKRVPVVIDLYALPSLCSGSPLRCSKLVYGETEKATTGGEGYTNADYDDENQQRRPTLLDLFTVLPTNAYRVFPVYGNKTSPSAITSVVFDFSESSRILREKTELKFKSVWKAQYEPLLADYLEMNGVRRSLETLKTPLRGYDNKNMPTTNNIPRFVVIRDIKSTNPSQVCLV